MRLSPPSRHRQSRTKRATTPPELRVDRNEPDWDYSVNVPGMDELGDLQEFEGQLYNSIIHEDEEHSPIRFSRQSFHDGTNATAACPMWFDEEERAAPPESLFYQTYRHADLPGSPDRRPKQVHSPIRKNRNTDIDEAVFAPEELKTPAASPKKPQKHDKTPKANNRSKANNRYKKKKYCVVHGSTIPPPSCPMAYSFPTFSLENDSSSTSTPHSTNSPTSITDIFQDLEELQSELDHLSTKRYTGATASFSLGSTSVASTILGSLDTSTVMGAFPDFEANDVVFECDGDETILDGNESSKEIVQQKKKPLSILKQCNKASCVMRIDNGGKKVLSWSKYPPVIIQNDGRKVYHYEIVKEDDVDCFLANCPTAAEF